MNIQLDKNRTVIVDSLKHDPTFYDEACHKAYRLVQLMKAYLINQHKFCIVSDAPLQGNGYDCGPYCLNFVQFKFERNPSIFDLPSNYKRYLMNRLLLEKVTASPVTNRVNFSQLNVVKHSKRKIEYNPLTLDNF